MKIYDCCVNCKSFHQGVPDLKYVGLPVDLPPVVV